MTKRHGEIGPDNMSVPERDWRVLRSVHRVALERYCTRVLDECTTEMRGTGSAHERYLRLFRLLQERDESIAAAFNDLRRSRAIQRLAAMMRLGVVTDAELSEFSAATRESAELLADLWDRPGKGAGGGSV